MHLPKTISGRTSAIPENHQHREASSDGGAARASGGSWHDNRGRAAHRYALCRSDLVVLDLHVERHLPGVSSTVVAAPKSAACVGADSSVAVAACQPVSVALWLRDRHLSSSKL